jgi:hypothetical protein
LLATSLVLLSALLVLLLRERAVALCCIAVFGLWLQSTFLVWDYGVFDGSAIDWDEHTAKGLVEILVWCLLIAAALARPNRIARHAVTIIVGILVLQLISLAGAYLSLAPPPDRNTAAATEPAGPPGHAGVSAGQFFSFSNQANVLVIVLDTFQSDFFAQLLQGDEFAAKLPPGFTYYRNAVAHYPVTYLSLPSILTSRTPARRPGAGEIVQAMQGSVPSRLSGQGWQSTLLTFSPERLKCGRLSEHFSCHSQLEMASILAGEQAGARAQRRRTEDARAVLRMAAFRSATHYLKPWLYDGGRWRLPDPFPAAPDLSRADPQIWQDTRRDIDIFNGLIANAAADAAAPTFKFLHFFGVHNPSSIGADCRWNGMDNPTAEFADLLGAAFRGREVAVDAAACMMSLVFDLLDRLDRLGVYDASHILVIGDHGRPATPVALEYARPRIDGVQNNRGQAEVKGSATNGVPLFLVKPPGARTALTVSDQPVALCDIPRTIFRELPATAVGEAYDCEAIQSIQGSRTTPRHHYVSGDPGKLMNKLEVGTPFAGYLVENHSWLEQSWVRTGVVDETAR